MSSPVPDTREELLGDQRESHATYLVPPPFHGNQRRAIRLPVGTYPKSYAFMGDDRLHVDLMQKTAAERAEIWRKGRAEPQTRERDHSVDRITIRLPRQVGQRVRAHLLKSGETQTEFFRWCIETLLGVGESDG